MGLTGKYNFPGIAKANAAGLRLLLRASPWTAWLASVPALWDLVGNWFANKGLVVLNVGASYIEGELDQRGMDKAMDKALEEITLVGEDKLTPQKAKEIDDAVIKAARKFVVINRHT